MSRDASAFTAPDPIERPALAFWLWARKLRFADLAEPLGVSTEQVRRYCLEFGHPERSVPGADVLARIAAVTDGKVTERDFYPPHIRGEAPAALSVIEGGR
jgi:hypothetical protein